MLPHETGSILCSFIFQFALPALIFSNIASTNIKEVFNIWFFIALFSTILILNLALWFVLSYFFHINGAKRIMLMMGSTYLNLAYVGIPIFTMSIGSIIPLTIAIMMQYFLIFPTILTLLEHFSDQKTKFSFVDTFRSLYKNPVMIVSLLAFLVLALNINVPGFLAEGCRLLGSAASAAGLFALGFSCADISKSDHGIVKDKEMITICVITKLIIMPVLGYILGRFVFNLDDWWLSALVMTCMLPTAMNQFIVSMKYNVAIADSQRIILFTTAGFSVTISLYLLTLGY